MDLNRRRHHPRPLSLSVLAASLALAAPPAAALAAEGLSAATATGSWDISEAEGPRKCRIMLRPESGASDSGTVGMPAGCRHAFPFLGGAGVWTVSADRSLALKDRAGRAVLTFGPAEEDRLIGTGPDGEFYEIEQVGKTRRPVAEAPATIRPSAASYELSPIRPLTTPGLRREATAEAPVVQVAAKDAAPEPVAPVVPYPDRPNDVAGRYTILRDGDRDVGCLLTLDASARGPGGHKAQLAPACRDQGIVVFDPVGWRFERGRLILRARKGHDLKLQYHADGVWRKDLKEGGKPLGFKKI